MDKYNLVELMEYIDPSILSYEEWLQVGMALKEEGYSVSDWDSWSRRDSRRYHDGECERKWKSFQGMGALITAGTLVQMAKEHGWIPQHNDYEIGWDDVIGDKDELVIVNKNWIEDKEVNEPDNWNPVEQLITYLETLFEASENVGYVTESWEKDGKYLPSKGAYDRTAGKLIEELSKCNGDIGSVIGDYKSEAGAWIRFNPLDGHGVKNENVTDFRYALVESDSMEIEKQNAIIHELELPVACLVHSGGKSVHAIVKIEAKDYSEYRTRVDYLYDICKKNGLEIDKQNRNPSRLSRMPGIVRNGKKQFLAGINIGKDSWDEWKEWIESVNDNLPDPESLTEVWDDMPELAKPLINGVLRQGHKMLLAGPSKAGKSYALIELTIAIAEGKKWLGWNCAKGRVLYVNLELDRASCMHRFKDVYEALKWKPENLSNIDIWNLRGKSVPMDKLAPKLIRRAAKKDYIAIIIDPIYKVITGDENSADQMAKFCNQFDLVCHDLGAAVIYCHHHSKGGQGQKRSMDRASGSGVFARDPDALIDLIELELNEDILKQKENEAVCHTYVNYLDKYHDTWEDHVSQDDLCSAVRMAEIADKYLVGDNRREAEAAVNAIKKDVHRLTAWRIEGTLREFPRFNPVNLWFDYPVHHIDASGALKDIEADGEKPPWQKATQKRKEKAKSERRSKAEEFEDAVNNCNMGEPPTVKDLSEWFSSTGKEVAERTIRDWIKKFGYVINKNDGNIVIKKEE